MVTLYVKIFSLVFSIMPKLKSIPLRLSRDRGGYLGQIMQEFGSLLISIAKLKFPDANITITEKRKISLEARIKVSENIFIEAYYNTLSVAKHIQNY